MKKLLIAAAVVAAAATAADAQRTAIRVVGSSTVFPFATKVIEEFAATTDYEAPVLSSDGSGGGFKLFCKGVGLDHPDISNASSRQLGKKPLCDETGVEFSEFMIGYDGIVLANANEGVELSVTLDQLADALNATVYTTAPNTNINPGCYANPYTKWSDIDPSLPAIEIEVLGPPSSSGTRAAFEEIVLEEKYDDVCDIEVRQDGHYIEAGENDSAIVDELAANPDAFGIFGYSFLANNADRIKGATVGGVAPTFEEIAAQNYPVSRSLYFYVKHNHLGVVDGMEEYIQLFIDMAQPGGALEGLGLIPGSEADRAALQAAADAL